MSVPSLTLSNNLKFFFLFWDIFIWNNLTKFMSMHALPNVTNDLNKKVMYAYSRLGHLATMDVKLHTLFEYIEALYKMHEVEEGMK